MQAAKADCATRAVDSALGGVALGALWGVATIGNARAAASNAVSIGAWKAKHLREWRSWLAHSVSGVLTGVYSGSLCATEVALPASAPWQLGLVAGLCSGTLTSTRALATRRPLTVLPAVVCFGAFTAALEQTRALLR